MKARIPGAPQGGANNMMKKIQEMQENMEKVQAEIEASEFTSSVGGGAVEVTVTGAHEVTAVNLKPEIVDPDDIEMLQDLIISATNESIRKATEAMEQGMEKAKGGLSIPGLF
ncbi:MAG: YbaB/EbfC family nucleoid-associated protein [Clostridia bacterium]|nr:YbaB/EbfC family nucleoid-associated protein [Clostridia bacterium]